MANRRRCVSVNECVAEALRGVQYWHKAEAELLAVLLLPRVEARCVARSAATLTAQTTSGPCVAHGWTRAMLEDSIRRTGHKPICFALFSTTGATHRSIRPSPHVKLSSTCREGRDAPQGCKAGRGIPINVHHWSSCASAAMIGEWQVAGNALLATCYLPPASACFPNTHRVAHLWLPQEKTKWAIN